MKQSRSVSQKQRILSHTPSKSKLSSRGANNAIESDYYFCHFKNAMYMGGIKAFQKHGRGIMIHDDGTCGVTSYFNDFKHGHNVLYRDNSIMSIQYLKNKMVEAVLRIQGYLLLIRFGKQSKPEGKAILIDYYNRTIHYVVYKKGTITQKYSQQEPSILNRIFDLENVEYLIGSQHAKAVKYQIQKDLNLASQKISNKFQGGFYKKGLLNGLGFIFMTKNPTESMDTLRNQNQNQMFLKVSERGYFINGQLNGMGEKWFKNGNYYYGQFKNGVFEGKGILKNQTKHNWVYGSFEMGNMSQLLDYSHQGNLRKLQKLVLTIHESKNNWINNEIQMQPHQIMASQIQNILQSNPTQKMRKLKQKKQQVLKRIQDNFLLEDNQNQNQNQNQIQQNSENKQTQNYYPEKQIRSNNSNNFYNLYDKKTTDSSSRSGAYFQSRPDNNMNTKNDEFGPNFRKINQTKRYNQQSGQQTSTYKIRLLQPNNSKQQTSRIKQPNNTEIPYLIKSSRQKSYSIQNSKVRPVLRQKQTQRYIERQRQKQSSRMRQNESSQTDPTFDEKRYIGKSRIFKQLKTTQQQQSSQSQPKFNYSPYK